MGQSIRSLWAFFAELRAAQRGAPDAARDGSVSVARQLVELVLLRAGPGKLNPEDYYLLRVYRRDLSFAEKRKFLSNTALGIIPRDKRWSVVADDKLLTYGLLQSHGIAVPETQAIFHRFRSFGTCPLLRTPEEVEDYVLSRTAYPFFAKPVQGIYSGDALLVEGVDNTGTELYLADGSRLPLKDFSARCIRSRSGFLFQEVLHPHEEIAELVGNNLCTTRMVVLIDDAGPRLLYALWKVAATGNMADNYWRKGNMMALLDRESGRIVSCTTGRRAELRCVETHPVSNRKLIGFKLPQWQELCELTLEAARVMPGLPVQAWDIAPTERGPVALEVNVGSMLLPQIAMQAGIYEGELRVFMEAHRR